jgi:CRISPR system Cascade subunit CasC
VGEIVEDGVRTSGARHLDIYVLQSVPPGLTNRDDAGLHKRVPVGGSIRMSWSPQAQKRAAQQHFTALGFPNAKRGTLLPQRVLDDLLAHGMPEDDAVAAVRAAFDKRTGIGIEVTKKRGKTTTIRTQAAVFAPPGAVEAIVRAILDYPDDPASRLAAVSRALSPSGVLNISLFGRFIAGSREDGSESEGEENATRGTVRSVEAATSVAPAIGVSDGGSAITTSLFSAVEEYAAEEDRGAAHLGLREVASDVLYRYASVDMTILTANLAGDAERAARGAAAFVDAFAVSVPSGGQHNSATFTRPALITLRGGEYPLNLADAFLAPIKPRAGQDLMALAIGKLTTYATAITDVYGGGTFVTVVIAPYRAEAAGMPGTHVGTLAELCAAAEAMVSAPSMPLSVAAS